MIRPAAPGSLTIPASRTSPSVVSSRAAMAVLSSGLAALAGFATGFGWGLSLASACGGAAASGSGFLWSRLSVAATSGVTLPSGFATALSSGFGSALVCGPPLVEAGACPWRLPREGRWPRVQAFLSSPASVWQRPQASHCHRALPRLCRQLRFSFGLRFRRWFGWSLSLASASGGVAASGSGFAVVSGFSVASASGSALSSGLALLSFSASPRLRGVKHLIRRQFPTVVESEPDRP